MELKPETLLKDIIKEYPWITEEAIKIDERLKIVKNPVGKMLLRKTTVQDLSDKAEMDVQDIINQIRTLIQEHQ